MTSSAEHRSRSLPAFPATGALVGGVFGILDALRSGPYESLPLASQLLVITIGWCIAAVTGLAAASLFRAGESVLRSSRRKETGPAVWAIAFSLSACVWILWIQNSYLRAVLVTAAAAIVFFVFAHAAARWPRLAGASFWGFLNAAGLIGLGYRITLDGPLAHGVGPLGALLFLAAAALSLTGFLIPLSRGIRRWAFGVSLALLLFLVLNWFAFPILQPPGRPGQGPGILLITVDTLRDDHLGCYGSATIRTPNIDRLADEGILFENTVCPIPLTNPSHTSILTGLYPARHGVLLNQPMELRPGLRTLPEMFEARGYRTAAFVSGLTLKRQTSCLVDRFQVYDDEFSPLGWAPEPCLAGAFAGLFFHVSRHVSFLPHAYTPRTERPAGRVRECAEQWLAANAGEPFFLWLHFFDPHGPYTPPPPYNRLYDPDYTGDVDGRWYSLSLQERERVIDSPRDLEHFKALYAGEVSYVDAEIGKILSMLEKLDLLGRTLIVLTADHGESLTEHSYYFDHSVCLYDPSLRVPLIFRFPGASPAGERHADLVQLIDVCPTILDWVGIEAPEETDGESLKDLCFGRTEEIGSRPALSAIFRGEIAGGKSLLGVRTSRYKYIRTSRWFGDGLLIPGSEEFYDLETDPEEKRNIVDSGVEDLEEYRTLADEYWDAWHGLEAETSGPVAAGVRERLRALGYLQ